MEKATKIRKYEAGPVVPKSQPEKLLLELSRAGNNKRAEIVDRLVEAVVEQTDDCFNLLNVVSNAVIYILEGNERGISIGERIIFGLEKRFKEKRVVNKSINPLNIDLDEKINKFRLLAEQSELGILAMNSSSQQRYAFALNVFRTIENTALNTINTNVVTFISDEAAGIPEVDEQLQLQSEYFRMRVEENYGDNSLHYSVAYPGNVIDLFKKARERSPVSLGFYTQEFGDPPVSLGDIFTETDRNERGKKALRFMASAPKGDCFWKYICQDLFIIYSVQDERLETESVEYKNKEISAIAFDIKSWIVEKMLLPAFGSDEDQEFDRLFSNYLAGGNYDDFCFLSMLVFASVTDQAQIKKQLTEGMTLAEAVQSLELPNTIIGGYPQVLEKQVRMISANFLSEKYKRIRDQLQQRFGHIPTFPTYLGLQDDLLKFVDVRGRCTSQWKALLSNQEQCEIYEDIVAEADSHSQRMPVLLGELRERKFKESSDDFVFTYNPDPNSRIASFGIKNLTIWTDIQNTQNQICFAINNADEELFVQGRITEEGEIQNVLVDFNECPQLLPLLKYAINAALEISVQKAAGAEMHIDVNALVESRKALQADQFTDGVEVRQGTFNENDGIIAAREKNRIKREREKSAQKKRVIYDAATANRLFGEVLFGGNS